jgi:hypothetical protein
MARFGARLASRTAGTGTSAAALGAVDRRSFLCRCRAAALRAGHGLRSPRTAPAGLGSTTLLVQQRASRWHERHFRRHGRLLLPCGLVAVSVYDGYFGAGAGVMTLAILVLLVDPELPASQRSQERGPWHGRCSRGDRVHSVRASPLGSGPFTCGRSVRREPGRAVSDAQGTEQPVADIRNGSWASAGCMALCPRMRRS